MPETNGVAPGRGAPTVYSEPTSSEPPDAEATMCVDGSAQSVTGAGGANSCPGAEELVRRFGGSEGAGPSLDQLGEEQDGPGCGDDALRTLGSCAAAVWLGIPSGGAGALTSGVLCAGNLGGLIECLATDDAANRREKP